MDESVSKEQAERPSIISLGRLIKRGIRLEWTKNGACLVLPNKKKISIPVYNNCPYANEEVLKIVKKLREIEEKSTCEGLLREFVSCTKIEDQKSATAG